MDNALTQNLNENQLDAVMHKDGPALIIAGPGSGKTRVITSRIAWLINNEKIPIQEIAALTFTNKAANEMKNRIFHMLDIPPIKFLPNIGTFHSFCAYLIRENHIQSNALDFDDLLMKTFEMLNSNQEISNIYQSKYKYLLIDEFQDTNLIQYSIAKLIANKTNNIFVVGDPDQSIYSWRNADITNILNF